MLLDPLLNVQALRAVITTGVAHRGGHPGLRRMRRPPVRRRGQPSYFCAVATQHKWAYSRPLYP